MRTQTQEAALSISFDHAAECYDETRGLPPDVQDQFGRAVLEVAEATRRTRILELGVGTRRIALPIIRQGYAYTGVDVSPRMLAKLREALRTIPGAAERVALVEGDMRTLPFADRSFDVVLTVHVYHLISDRVAAVTEGIRVLTRPGVALNGREEAINDALDDTRAAWHEILRSLGWQTLPFAEWNASHYVGDEWHRLGGVVERVVALEGDAPWVPAQWIEAAARRQASTTWSIPDEIYPEAIQRLRAWADQYYGPRLHTPQPCRHRLIIERARFV